MRGKLLIEWDLTFNFMYKHVCILIKVYLVSISAIHKNSISNQMGVVDGRANRVTRLMTVVYVPPNEHIFENRKTNFASFWGRSV